MNLQMPNQCEGVENDPRWKEGVDILLSVSQGPDIALKGSIGHCPVNI